MCARAVVSDELMRTHIQTGLCSSQQHRSGVGKLFSRRAALTIQEVAEDRIDHFKRGQGPVLKIL